MPREVENLSAMQQSHGNCGKGHVTMVSQDTDLWKLTVKRNETNKKVDTGLAATTTNEEEIREKLSESLN